MSRASIFQGVLLLLYLAFFAWYTSFDGPLRPEEIEHYMGLATGRGERTSEELAELRAFLESDTGDDFVMMNVIKLREPPTQVEGVKPGDTASDVLGKYMEFMWPALLSRACHPVIGGSAASAALDVWGIENARLWSTAAFMRYRSRRDMLEIATNPDFRGPHEFKIAAMSKTIAFAVDPWIQLGDPRLVLALLFAVVGLLAGRSRAS